MSHAGKHNGGWKGGVSARWAKRFKKKTCERCAGTQHLEVHHRDRNPRNNQPSNLRTLCRSCHELEHRKPRNCVDCSKRFKPKAIHSKRCPCCIRLKIRKSMDRWIAKNRAHVNAEARRRYQERKVYNDPA